MWGITHCGPLWSPQHCQVPVLSALLSFLHQHHGWLCGPMDWPLQPLLCSLPCGEGPELGGGSLMAPLLTSSVTLAGIASEPQRPVSSMLGLVVGIKGDPTRPEPGVELAFSKRGCPSPVAPLSLSLPVCAVGQVDLRMADNEAPGVCELWGLRW